MRLLETTIDRYGPIGGWAPALSDGLTVLSGPNEAGKTLFLEALVQLLEPGVGDILDPPPRYDDDPVGHVVLEHRGERHALGGNRCLSEISNIQPADLPTVFVVRDNDLAMPAESSYYTSLIEHLGEVHTSTIEDILDELKRLGRLTDRRLDISDTYDNAKSTLNEAEELIDDIEAYLDTIETDGLDTLERERIAIVRELHAVDTDLSAQREAERIRAYEQLQAAIETVESSEDRLDELTEVTDDRLATLQELSADVRHLDAEVDTNQDQLERLTRLHETVATQYDELADEYRRYERRTGAVETAADALATYRSHVAEAVDAERQHALGRVGTLGGAIATGLIGAAGAIADSTGALLFAGGLLIASLGAAGWTYRTGRTIATVDHSERQVIDAAQDAGLSIDDIDSVAAEIEAFSEEFESINDRRIRIEERLARLEDDIEKTNARITDLNREREKAESERDSNLRTAGVDDVETFAALVEERTSLEDQRRLARQRLSDGLGAVEETDALEVEEWRRRCDELVEGIDLTTVTADSYDPALHDELTSRRKELTEQRDELETALDEYDTTIARFDERVRALETRSLIDTTITLEGRSPRALESVVDALRDCIETVENDAAASRHAVEIFRDIKASQEQKITELFAKDGATSQVFSRITGGRYEHVEYDAAKETLVAVRPDGTTLAVDSLSAGATDQLYLSSRLSLAERLLDGDPGFLILDDPLVAADLDRLHRGFDALSGLVDEGWQILYLTAKAEVSEQIVQTFDLHHETIENRP